MSPTLWQDPRWQVRLLVGFIFFGLFLLLPSVAKYHGDECFYTNAAIRMAQSGEYVTPYAASGALRFAKPILPYWAVLAGYGVFGINFLGSRVVFLAACCLVLWLTYRLSLDLFNRPKEAALAAFIVGSNVQLLTIAIRSTPDALLCLFVLLSLLGFARLIFSPDASWRNFALAYVGAGLAIETRGLPGVAVVAFPWLFCLVLRRGQTPLRRLFEWKAATLGLLVAGSWFGVMLWLHGRALVDGFYYDQITENVQGYRILDSLRNLNAYGTGVLRHFLPWSALLLLGLLVNRAAGAVRWRQHRSQCWFLLGWFLFILTPFIFGEFHRTRYMIVAYPLLAVLLAAMLSAYAEHQRFQDWTRGAVRGAAALLALAGLALAGIGGAMAQLQLLGAGLVFALTDGAVWVIMRQRISWASWTAIAAIPLMAFWTTELFLRPIFSRSPAAALTARLLPEGTPKRRVYAWKLSPSVEAQMRVLSGGRLTVVPLSGDTPPAAALDGPLVFAESEKAALGNLGGVLEQIGFASGKWRVRDVRDWLRASTRQAALSRTQIPYYVRFPEPKPKP